MSITLLVVIPLLFAFISILSKKIAPYLLIIGSLSLTILIGYMPLGEEMIGGYNAPYGISLILDSYSFFALYVVNVLFALVIIINVKRIKELSSILLVGLAGLNGLLLTGDLFNLFVFLEITGISAYLISTVNKKPIHTFHYLVAGTVGSSLYLLGLVILYNMFGTLNMNGLSLLLKDVDSIYVAFPFLLMFIGLGVEAKLLPFNSWVKGILGSSTVLSGAMLASVYASASLLVFGRLLTNVFVMSDSLMLIVSVILAIGIFAGEAMAYSSTKLREVLLFSSIAQAAIAVLVFTYGFVGYGLLFVGFLGFSKMILFLVVNTMIEQTKTDEIEDYKGVFRNHLVIGISFSMIVLSVLGLPLFAGFMIKVGILQELVMSGNLLFPFIILVSSVIEGVYFIKLLVALWYKETEELTVSFELPLVYLSVVVALLVLILGMYYMPLHDFVNVLARGGLLW